MLHIVDCHAVAGDEAVEYFYVFIVAVAKAHGTLDHAVVAVEHEHLVRARPGVVRPVFDSNRIFYHIAKNVDLALDARA